MTTATLFVLVLAAVLILLAALKFPEPSRVSYGWMGLFLLVLATALGKVGT